MTPVSGERGDAYSLNKGKNALNLSTSLGLNRGTQLLTIFIVYIDKYIVKKKVAVRKCTNTYIHTLKPVGVHHLNKTKSGNILHFFEVGTKNRKNKI